MAIQLEFPAYGPMLGQAMADDAEETALALVEIARRIDTDELTDYLRSSLAHEDPELLDKVAKFGRLILVAAMAARAEVSAKDVRRNDQARECAEIADTLTELCEGHPGQGHKTGDRPTWDLVADLVIEEQDTVIHALRVTAALKAAGKKLDDELEETDAA